MDNHTYAVLPPVADTLVIGGETLDLTPIRVGEIPAFSCAIRPVVSGLSDLRPDWVALISEHGDAVIDAVAIATRRPRDWVAGLELDDAVRLACAVFEVNADFFTRQVIPKLDVLFATTKLPLAAAGSMPSST